MLAFRVLMQNVPSKVFIKPFFFIEIGFSSAKVRQCIYMK